MRMDILNRLSLGLIVGTCFSVHELSDRYYHTRKVWLWERDLKKKFNDFVQSIHLKGVKHEFRTVFSNSGSPKTL